MKLSAILLTLLLLPFSATFGQAIDETIIYGGLKYDQNAYVSATGIGFKAGSGVWTFLSGGPANDGAEIATEGVYLFYKGDFCFGPILGPNIDWVDTQADSMAPVAYLLGSTGWLIAYGLGEDFGAWVFVKNRMTFGETSYEPDTQFGLGLYFKL